MKLQQFENLWIDVEHIISVGFDYEKDFGATESGLVIKGGTQKLKSVAIVFDNGVNINFTGPEADAFKSYWDIVTKSFGDIS